MLGYYQFDDEGVPAQRVALVDHGVLKNFEMSRSPLVGFPHSNGHGRRQLGATPVSRQGNLIVQSSKTMTNAQLRARLIELIKAQGKLYGLLIDDIAGGFTFTGRGQPQAFQVQPLVVYRVYADGRPDELVRGVDIVGTPLSSFKDLRTILFGHHPGDSITIGYTDPLGNASTATLALASGPPQ